VKGAISDDSPSRTTGQKWWVLCSFAYLRWRRRDVCNFHMIYMLNFVSHATSFMYFRHFNIDS
jgi:hypothetical protein